MGSQQRVYTLVRYLVEQGNDVAVYFSASAEIDHPRALVPVFSSIDFTSPLSTRKLFYYRCLGWVKELCRFANWKRYKRRKRDRYPTWRDFVSEVDRAAFRKLVDQKKPQVILVEYIWLTRLISNLPRRVRNSVQLIIDTHDVMYERTRAFIARGRPIQLGADEADEADALRYFDLVLAIQSDEANKLANLCPGIEILTVPHALECVPAEGGNTEGCNLLYVGTDTVPNADGLREFIESVWPQLHAEDANIRFDVVGSVCNKIENQEEYPSINFHGRVENLMPYYEQATIVVAPVPYGSGLKIKVVEALGYGKPLVTTPVGSEGMDDGVGSAFLVAADPEEFVAHCKHLAENARDRTELGKAALAYAKQHFSRSAAFGELGRRIALASAADRPPK